MKTNVNTLMAFIFTICTVPSMICAQNPVDPSESVGLPTTVFHGTNIEHVDLMSGALIVNLPLLNFPGRGIPTTIILSNTSKNWQTGLTSDIYGDIWATYSFAPDFYGNQTNGWNIGVPRMGQIEPVDYCETQNEEYGGCLYQYLQTENFRDTDGTTSTLLSTAGMIGNANDIPQPYPRHDAWTYDGSYKYYDGSDGAVVYSDGLRAYDGPALIYKTVMDHGGNYQVSAFQEYLRDRNGNEIFTTSNGWVDTVGRTINDVVDSSTETEAIQYYDSNANLQSVVIQYGEFTLEYPVQVALTDQSCSVEIRSCYYYPGAGGGLGPNGTWYLPTSVTYPDGSIYRFDYIKNQDGTTTGEIAHIHYPTGGYVRYTYGFPGYMYSGNCSQPTDGFGYCLGIGQFRVVTSRSVSPTGLSTDEQTWTYNLAQFNGAASITDPLGNVHTEQFDENELFNLPQLGGFTFDQIAPPSVIATSDVDGQGHVLSQTASVISYDNNLYALNNDGCLNCNNRHPESVTTMIPSTGMQSQITYTYDDYGNTTSKTESAWASGTPGSILRTTVSSYLPSLSPTYASGGVHVLNGVVTETVSGANCSGSSNLCTQTTKAYDQYNTNPSGIGLVSTNAAVVSEDYVDLASQLLRGNITSETDGYGAITATKYFAYNDIGEVVDYWDPVGNKTSYSYSDNYARGNPSVTTLGFLTQITKAPTGGVQHVERFQYYYGSGALAASCGENFPVGSQCSAGMVAPISDYRSFIYDSSNRVLKGSYGDGGWESLSYPDVNHVELTNAVGYDELEVYDGLGRKQQTQIKSASPIIYQETQYDVLSRISSVTNPHFASSSITDGTTFKSYDALGRETIETQPDGSRRQWCYDNQNVSGQNNCITNHSSLSNNTWVDMSDESGRHWQQVKDGLGHLVSVMEPDSTDLPSLETVYGYDATGSLVSVNQKGVIGENARARSFSYDPLSRLLFTTNPESGTIHYASYDANGNLLYKTDANNVVTSYSYDTLNRLKYKGSSDGTVSDTYYYDVAPSLWGGTPFACTNGIGRLCQADHIGYSGTAFNYDPLGRTASTLYGTINLGPPYLSGISASYDLAGNVTQLTYPDGRQVTQSFDGAGRLATVNSGGTTYMGGASGSSGISYTPAGAAQSFAFGNGVSQTNLYNNRLQPCHTMVSSPLLGSNPTGGNLLDRASYYSPLGNSPTNCGSEAANNGNMYAVVDNLNTGWSQGFTYDSLNRLTSAGRSDGGYNHTYNYDSFGNLIVQDNLHTNLQYAIDPATNELLLNPLATDLLDQYGHQANAFQYDFAGNMVSSGISTSFGHQYTYDALSQVTSVDGGNTAQYSYNANDERAIKTTPSGWTDYVYFNGQPMSELSSTGVWSDYIYANGQKIAKVDSQKAVFHVQGYRDGSDTTCGEEGPLNNSSPGVVGMTIAAGDKLVFDLQQNLPMYGGLAFIFTNGDGTGDVVDTNGTGQPLYFDGEADGQWHHMVGSLARNVGETVAYPLFGTHDWAPLGNFSVSLANAAVVHANGSITPIYNGQQASVYAFTGNTCGGQAMTNGTVLMPITDPTMNTTYFLDDHLGTAQMQLSGGGWPMWQGQFTPFGAELSDGSTDMHYKFTGKERDAESGLDYFGARYYASGMGRWMSPDWADKPEAVPYSQLDYPQSLALYQYVGNNPLSKADPDGHCYPLCTMVAGGLIGAAGEAIHESYQGNGYSWKKIGAAALGGVVTGVVGPLGAVAGGGVIAVGATAVAGSIAGGVTEKMANSAMSGKQETDYPVTKQELAVGAISGAVGAATDGLGGKIASPLIRNAVQIGSSLLKEVTQRNTQEPKTKPATANPKPTQTQSKPTDNLHPAHDPLVNTCARQSCGGDNPSGPKK